MKSTIAAVAVAMLLVLTAQARLGETIEQIEVRYGKPFASLTNIVELVGTAERLNFYDYNGYRVGVYSKNNASYLECYERDVKEWERPNTISDDLALKIMSVNANGMKWKRVDSTNNTKVQKQWIRDDGAIAYIDLLRTTFFLVSAEAVKDQQAENAKDKEKSLSGF